MCTHLDIPLVSVIIPTFGRADMLGRAVDSVLNQTYQNIEIIVVNDNPKESIHFELTMQLLAKYSDESRIKIFADGLNRGGSLARNKGIEISVGSYLGFLDDDDYYYENKIEKHLKHMRESDADVSVCNMDFEIEGNIQKRTDGKAIVGNLANFLLFGRTFTPMIFLKRKVAYSVNFFSEAPQFQDHVFMIKILEKEFKVNELDQSLFVHNIHFEQRITQNRIFLKNYSIRREYEARNLKNLSDTQYKQYFLKYYLTNARYYREEKSFICFLKNLKISLSYICNISNVLEIVKVFLSYFVK